MKQEERGNRRHVGSGGARAECRRRSARGGSSRRRRSARVSGTVLGDREKRRNEIKKQKCAKNQENLQHINANQTNQKKTQPLGQNHRSKTSRHAQEYSFCYVLKVPCNHTKSPTKSKK